MSDGSRMVANVISLQIVIPTLDRSGAEKQFALLAAGLPRDEFNVEVLALSRGGPYEEVLKEAGIPVTILKKRGRFDLLNLLQVRRHLQQRQPDIVLSCIFSANSAVRLATLGMRKRPITIISERCVDSWKSGWQKQLDRMLISRTNRLVANSQSVADFYQELGVPESKLRVIPNGVEVPALPGLTREELLEQLNIPQDAKLVAFSGRLAQQKGIHHLIWGIQLLRQADPRAYLLLIGDGPERRDLEERARILETTDHVRFLGHRSDAASLLHLIDVFWLASKFEGMSNSLMEAMACGKPVIVSDIPPNRELVRHDQEGYLISDDDVVGYVQYSLRLFQDDAEAKRLGDAGAKRMQEAFSTKNMIDRYANLLRSEYLATRNRATKNSEQKPDSPQA